MGTKLCINIGGKLRKMTQSRGSKDKNIPPDKVFCEHLDWFDLGQTCVTLIETGRTSENSVKMPENCKLQTGDKLENMLTSRPLKSQSKEKEYGKIYDEMKTQEVNMTQYELDSGISSDYDSADSERENEKLSDEIQIESELVMTDENKISEVENSPENDLILENNKKLTACLMEEVEKCKQYKTKYSAVQKELETAEITVKELTSIECDLRISLEDRKEEIRMGALQIDHLEEENASLRERLGRFKKRRWRDNSVEMKENTDSENYQMNEKYIKIEKELEQQKLKYRDREREFENSLEITKQQILKWEENRANDMVKMAFNVSGITIEGLEPVMNSLCDKINQKQDIINKKTQEMENLKIENSEKLGKTQRFIDHIKRERLEGTEVLRTKLVNWKNYFLDLENDHYAGLQMYNTKIEELQRKLKWEKKYGRNSETSNIKTKEVKDRENLELRNKLKNAEEQMAITSEKLISAKEEIGELGNVYQEERRNVGKLRNELKEMDVQILSYKDEANKLTVKVRELEQIKRKSEERTNPEESETEGRMAEEIRRLKIALDGKINELKKFKEGYGNSKKEHEKVKKKLIKEIEELHIKLQEKKENDNEDMESLKDKNNELSTWQSYVEDDLNNIIWKIEKLEDDLNMRIGSKSNLLEETKNLVQFMKKILYKYNPEEEVGKSVDHLSLQDIEKKMEEVKDQLRHKRSGSREYLELIEKLENLEMKLSIIKNGENLYIKDEIYMKEVDLGVLWQW